MKLIHLWYHSPYTPFLWMFKQMGVSLPLDCMPLSANANLKLSGLNELTHCRKSALSMYTIKSIKCSQQDLTPQSSKKLLNRLLHQNYMYTVTLLLSLYEQHVHVSVVSDRRCLPARMDASSTKSWALTTQSEGVTTRDSSPPASTFRGFGITEFLDGLGALAASEFL